MNPEFTSETFINGSLLLPNRKKSFTTVEWTKHPAFEGVELKHLLTAKDTDGQFSYHLVRIAPNKSILNHIHETQLETHEVIAGTGFCKNDGADIPYQPGVISIFQKSIAHEVHADDTGLFLFAKFMPALC